MEHNILQDKFGRQHDYLRISLTDACNLRCVYCMPNEKVLVTPSAKMMQVDEILELARLFVDLGVKKIRLTGGEPLLRKDFPVILSSLATLPIKISISTNAVLVDRYIADLKAANINSINISLDTLDAQEFFRLTKRQDFDKIMANIALLLEEGFRLKVNIVVMKGINEHAILDFVEWTKDKAIDVRFIEFMPFQGNSWKKEQVFGYRDMLQLLDGKFAYERLADSPNDTAKHYQVPGHQGKFAFITTITEPFCSTCNRIRLTADGKLKNCLFSTGEVDLLTALRNKEPLLDLIEANISSKKQERGGIFDRASVPFDNLKDSNRSMIKIGG